jgi:uncharacterized protein
VKLNVHEIEEDAKSLAYEEPTDSLNGVLVHGQVCDFEMPATSQVRIEYYRAGQELFFQGHISSDVIGHCARCLEPYPFTLGTDFSLGLLPKQPLPAEIELKGEELDIGYYNGDEIDLTPLIREQIILALPTRPLCREDCKGLCANCGANLNTQACRCTAHTDAPRLAVLRNLKIGH